MALEERFGLSWLFWTRGPLEPPSDVVVVSLDGVSGERLGLAARLREWPRRLYAELIERLVDDGCAVIVFDLRLDQPRDPANEPLWRRRSATPDASSCSSISSANNRPMPGGGEAVAGVFTTEQVHPPIAPFGRGRCRPRAVSPAQGAGAREPVLGVFARAASRRCPWWRSNAMPRRSRKTGGPCCTRPGYPEADRRRPMPPG